MSALTNDAWSDLSLDDADLLQLLDTQTSTSTATTTTTAATETPNKACLRVDGFDKNAGDCWIYPSNLPERAYQLNIVQAALFRNTLVVLPTGLGKTFIAAVVMYNIYRWFPTSKVLFMAPTRPLVAQQIAACQRIMPFPTPDTVELTGKLQRARRMEQWRAKRVFFATPQVVQSDIAADVTQFPFAQLRLVVVDEAHKAKGRYAYVEVLQTISQQGGKFRVLALSATPGRTMEDVAELVRNLFISHVEVRCENSIDVQQYVHKRHMRTVVVPLGEEIKKLREDLLLIIDPYLRQLVDAGVLHASLYNVNRNMLLYEQKRFRERTLQQRHPQQSVIGSNFSICISLCHALELLERHGMRVFLNYYENDGDQSNFVLRMDRKLRDLVEHLKRQLGPNPFDVSAHAMTNGELAEMPQDLDFGHPKFEQARKCVLEHFEAKPDSRAIIFCEYRESVMLIYRLLLQHVPLLKPRCFVGQGGSSGTLRALTQKQQIQIMNDFRVGKSNILVATCIGEEGIDVGEVELIVCFDISTSNPTRFVQRIGRTGRQKQGNVVMLVSEGKEQQLLKDALAQKDLTNRKILQSPLVRRALLADTSRLVPNEYNPQCVRMYVKSPEQERAKEPQQTISPKAKKQSPKKKLKCKVEPIKGSQDLRKFFKPPTKALLDADELEIFDVNVQAPGTQTQKATTKQLKQIEDYFQEFDVSLNSSVDPETVPSATPQTAQTKELDPALLRRIDKLLASQTPLLPKAKQITDFEQLLKLSDLSNDNKRLLLKSRPHYVRELRQQMEVLNVLKIEANTSISVEEHEIRQQYELIERICGGSDTDVQELLDEADAEVLERECKIRADPWAELYDSDFDGGAEEAAKVEQIFATFESAGANCDNFDYIQTEMQKTQRFKQFLAERNSNTTAGESMVYDTLPELEHETTQTTRVEDFSITDSRYSSQWGDFAKYELPHKSTPLMTSRKTACSINCLPTVLESPIPKSRKVENDVKRDIKEIEASNVTANKIETEAARVTSADTTITSKTIKRSNSSNVNLLNELNFDLDVFLEPFPEEEMLVSKSSPTDSLKENAQNHTTTKSITNAAKSPDIFNDTSKSTEKNRQTKETENVQSVPKISSLATKLAAKCNIAANQKPATASTPIQAALSAPVMFKSPNLGSPTHQGINTNTAQYLKSPSLFDMYLKGMRGRSQQVKTSFLVATKSAPGALHTPTREQNESLIVPRPTVKRKIIDSDSSEQEKSENDLVKPLPRDNNPETDDTGDFEDFENTEIPKTSKSRPRKKQRRNCSFFDMEAAVSGTDSDDEPEPTEDNYQLDSIVVSSGEEDNAADRTNIQAMYLRSLRSPQKRPGAYKIPARRVYNDHADIFSQAIPVEPSQYLPDSFVVSEDEENTESEQSDVVVDANATMSPLTRAERILKERRRAKRQQNANENDAIRNRQNVRRRVQTIEDDSTDDDFV